MPEMGMVRTQAHMMLLATPQRTALKRCTLPTPMIPPAMVCVVETGIPAIAVPSRLTAAALSAQKPQWKEIAARPLPAKRRQATPVGAVPPTALNRKWKPGPDHPLRRGYPQRHLAEPASPSPGVPSSS